MMQEDDREPRLPRAGRDGGSSGGRRFGTADGGGGVARGTGGIELRPTSGKRPTTAMMVEDDEVDDDDLNDVQPLLSAKEDGQGERTAYVSARDGAGVGMHPHANSSFACDEHSCVSKLNFSWIRPVLHRSRGGRELNLEDTLQIPDELKAAALAERFWRKWDAILSSGQRPSLAYVLYSIFSREVFMSGVFRFTTELAKMLAPMVLRELILFVKGEASTVPNSLAGGVSLAFFLFALVLLQAFALQHFIYVVFVVGAGFNTVATVAVYDKSLRLSGAALEGPRLGQAINYQARDASTLREFMVFLHNLWASPMSALGCTILLLHVLGYSALVGIALIPILIPLETWVAKRSAKFRKSVLHVADARMNLIGEIVDGIKTVKLNSLDAAFRHRVEVLRVKELSSIRRALTLYAYNQAVMRSSPLLVALATFAAYTLSGHELDAQTAFTALALFGTISHPFHVIPKAVQLLADAKVSVKRLEDFLLEKETERADAFDVPAGNGGSGNGNGRLSATTGPKIVLQDAAFTPVAGGDPCLQGVTAEMGRGLSVLVGPVGCGKTTLLQGIVEHLPTAGHEQNARREQQSDSSGIVNSGGGGSSSRRVVGQGVGKGVGKGGGVVKVYAEENRVAFCPDSPWIINASARENICLGRSTGFDEAAYLGCVKACALEQDFEEWPQGDRTIIGAKGITISGGQKARLSIARAVYARCGVVLMDDPLSALDNIVGSWVFKNALLEMAQRAAVVMSTHQSQYMRDRADCRVFLVEKGTVTARTDYSGRQTDDGGNDDDDRAGGDDGREAIDVRGVLVRSRGQDDPSGRLVWQTRIMNDFSHPSFGVAST